MIAGWTPWHYPFVANDSGLPVSARFLKVAVLWLVACTALGIYMGATTDHGDRQVHVHGQLLGWLSGVTFGLSYRAWPELADSSMAVPHFWLHNIGLLTFAAGLALMVRGSLTAAAVLQAASALLMLSALCFALVVWRRMLPC